MNSELQLIIDLVKNTPNSKVERLKATAIFDGYTITVNDEFPIFWIGYDDNNIFVEYRNNPSTYAIEGNEYFLEWLKLICV